MRAIRRNAKLLLLYLVSCEIRLEIANDFALKCKDFGFSDCFSRSPLKLPKFLTVPKIVATEVNIPIKIQLHFLQQTFSEFASKK